MSNYSYDEGLYEKVLDWCNQNGWTDLFVECYRYWAFPPGGVIPEPLPADVVGSFASERSLSTEAKCWYGATILTATLAAFASFYWNSMMPVTTVFVFAALVLAKLDEEERERLP